MPQIRFARAALRDLERLRAFLQSKSPDAAKRAAIEIKRSTLTLMSFPQAGRPTDDMQPEYRELLIDFGDSGYIALYRLDDNDAVTVLAIRHQKEAGY